MGRLDKIYIGTNTKMFKNIAETVSYVSELQESTKDIDRNLMELFVIPSYTALGPANASVQDHLIKIGAQNMYWEEKGAFTGELSPLMLKELNITIVEIGHSERRHIIGETDEDVKKKVEAACRYGFTPLLCVGETLEQKEYGISDEVLSIQLKIGLSQVSKEDAKKLLIAYEPVWAIGENGIPADEGYANERHIMIKEIVTGLFGEKAGCDVPVLYGGSVNSENAKGLICQSAIDGLFIGRSAWQANDFNKIIRSVLPLYAQKKGGYQSDGKGK